MEAIFGGIKVDVNFAGNFQVFPQRIVRVHCHT